MPLRRSTDAALPVAYPLQWPEGWPRTPPLRRSYNWQLKRATFDSARQDLYKELRLLDAKSIVLSTSIPLRQDGHHYATQRPVDGDPGIAIYFTLRGKQMAMARDCYDNVAQNLRSLGLATEHLRGLDRHGGASMLERAFSGFTALPPPGGQAEEAVDWRVELGPIPEGLDNADLLAILDARYRNKAKAAHSDGGGDDAAMIRLNLAIKLARDELRA
jgi:hypothetical protein